MVHGSKVSIVTPTYNDCDTLPQMLQSIIAQNYQNWEWVVVNDGSTDDTESVIHALIDQYHLQDKVVYKKQPNADQLNALLTAAEVLTGDYVFVLHSDDLLPNESFLTESVHMIEQTEADGLFGDLQLINQEGALVGKQLVMPFVRQPRLLPLMLLWLGRNLFSDVGFHKARVFRDQIKETYLTWNMPLWFYQQEGQAKMLNYRTASFPMLQYRIHDANYINNTLGLMNVLNGELRTAVTLTNYYHIPVYRFQYTIFRLWNRVFPRRPFPVWYENRPSANRAEIVSFIVAKRYPNYAVADRFAQAVVAFYRARTERVIRIEKLPDDLPIYKGKDVRHFNKKLLADQLEPFYCWLLSEMEQGFRGVSICHTPDKEKVRDVLKFMCITGVQIEGAL